MTLNWNNYEFLRNWPSRYSQSFSQTKVRELISSMNTSPCFLCIKVWLYPPSDQDLERKLSQVDLGVNVPLDWDTRMKIALDAARDLPTCRRTPSHASSVDVLQASGQDNLITWARSILRNHKRLRGKHPKEVEYVCVCTIAAACVAAEENPNPRLTMGVVAQSLKMVQRITEYQVCAHA